MAFHEYIISNNNAIKRKKGRYYFLNSLLVKYDELMVRNI